MALYQYFQPSDDLPDPSGPLSASVSPAAIKDANEAVRSATRSQEASYARIKIRKFYQKGIYTKICTSQNFQLYGNTECSAMSGKYEQVV